MVYNIENRKMYIFLFQKLQIMLSYFLNLFMPVVDKWNISAQIHLF